jgi:hypothetical protein
LKTVADTDAANGPLRRSGGTNLQPLLKEIIMSHLRTALTLAATALLLGLAPLARSHDALWHRLEVTDGYTPSAAHAPEPRAATRADQRAPGTFWEHELAITDGAGPNPDHDRMKAEMARGTYVEQPSTPAAAPAPRVCELWLKQIHQSDGYSYTC